MTHFLKIKQCYLIHLLQGKKNFEIRKNDRDFQSGDYIRFQPLEDEEYNVYESHPAPLPDFEIRYVHYSFGMKKGYVVMAVAPVNLGKIEDRNE